MLEPERGEYGVVVILAMVTAAYTLGVIVGVLVGG